MIKTNCVFVGLPLPHPPSVIVPRCSRINEFPNTFLSNCLVRSYPLKKPTAGTHQWGFGRWFPFSKWWFSGSILVFRGVSVYSETKLNTHISWLDNCCFNLIETRSCAYAKLNEFCMSNTAWRSYPNPNPVSSIYAIFNDMWVVLKINVGKMYA